MCLVLSIIQTSAEFRGRVFGLNVMLTRLLVPVALVDGATVAGLTGRNVLLLYALCGALALSTVALLALRSSTRAFLASS